MKMFKEDEKVYHAKSKSGEIISAGMLKKFKNNPIIYRMETIGLIEEQESSAYKFGSACHKYVLEGKDAFESAYYVGELINDKTGKPFGSDTQKVKEWETKIGKPVISTREFQAIEEMDFEIKHFGESKELFETGDSEMVVRGNLFGVECQIKIDWICLGWRAAIVDLKTCQDINQFTYDFAKYDYGFNLAFYQMLASKERSEFFPVYVVATEKLESHRCATYKLTEDFMEGKRKEVTEAINFYKRCKENGEFTNNFRELQFIDIKK